VFQRNHETIKKRRGLRGENACKDWRRVSLFGCVSKGLVAVGGGAGCKRSRSKKRGRLPPIDTRYGREMLGVGGWPSQTGTTRRSQLLEENSRSKLKGRDWKERIAYTRAIQAFKETIRGKGREGGKSPLGR